MFTAIITAAWRGFGVDRDDNFTEIRLGFIGFAIVKGTFWQQHTSLKEKARTLQQENKSLRLAIYGDRCDGSK